MSSTFDPTKPVQTRGGQLARIICADKRGAFPIIALVGETEKIVAFNANGHYLANQSSMVDLVNVPERRFRNVYVDSCANSGWHSTRERADNNVATNSPRFGVLEVEVVDDEYVNPVFHAV